MSKTTSEPVRHITSANLTNVAFFLIPPSGTKVILLSKSKVITIVDALFK